MSFSHFQLDTSKFSATMDKLAAISSRTDAEIVTLNSIAIIRAIAYNSPKRSGNMNRGWLPAWNALGAAGTPNTASRRRGGSAGRRYVAAGRYVDGRRAQTGKFFEFVNESHYVRRTGAKYRYPVVVATRTNFMRKAEAEVAAKFERQLATNYRKFMRGASA